MGAPGGVPIRSWGQEWQPVARRPVVADFLHESNEAQGEPRALPRRTWHLLDAEPPKQEVQSILPPKSRRGSALASS